MNKRAQLIAARLGKGWSQEALAEKIGITDPYPLHVQHLCNVFALSTEDLDLVNSNKEVAFKRDEIAHLQKVT
jgi:hypothetical protein